MQDQAAAKPLGYASTARPQKYACGMPQFSQSQLVFSVGAVDGGNWFREVFSDTDINYSTYIKPIGDIIGQG